MSLWSKPVEQIGFGDVDEFCKSKQPEGARLDYKGIEFPKDLAKTIAAFANTLGGLIVLGVDADKTDNTPIWPPNVGMPIAPGITERVIQIAQDAIYPPVRVDVSNVINNELLPGHVVVVIRIPESREAPHAVEKNTRVYVYGRAGNKSDPYELADVDRIEQLLSRRKRLIDQREAELQENLSRAARVMHSSKCPIRWASVCPVYPWRNIHDYYDCKGFHQLHLAGLFNGHWSYQTIPNGSFAIGRRRQEGQEVLNMACSSVSANGNVFGIVYADEVLSSLNRNVHLGHLDATTKLWVDMRNFKRLIVSVLDSGRQFYELSKDTPGEVMLSVGMMNAFGVWMYDTDSQQKSDSAFPDPEYRVDTVLNVRDLGMRMPMLNDLFGDIMFAFNANAVPM